MVVLIRAETCRSCLVWRENDARSDASAVVIQVVEACCLSAVAVCAAASFASSECGDPVLHVASASATDTAWESMQWRLKNCSTVAWGESILAVVQISANMLYRRERALIKLETNFKRMLIDLTYPMQRAQPSTRWMLNVLKITLHPIGIHLVNFKKY